MLHLLVECTPNGCEHIGVSEDPDRLVFAAQCRHLHINMRPLADGAVVETDDFQWMEIVLVEKL